MSTERLRKAMEQERRERLRDVERLEEEAKKPRPSHTMERLGGTKGKRLTYKALIQ